MNTDLQRKLRRLGVVKGFKALQKQPPQESLLPSVPITDNPLPGELFSTAHGPIWVDLCHYPATYTQGSYALGAMADLSPATLALLGTPDLGHKLAFLDTETTGLAGGAGTLAFLIGIGLWDGEKFSLHLVFLRSPDEETNALRYVGDLLAQATGLVTFNGLGFDVPLLESRFILNRLPPRWLSLPHLDLLPVARTLWRDHLPSRRLIALETDILGIQRTQEDLPSWMIPSLYRQFLQDGKPGAMASIFYHNRIDVLSLAALLVHMARLAETPEELCPDAAEWVGLGRLYHRAGQLDTALNAWECAVSGEYGELLPELAERVWQELGLHHKRQGAWEPAMHVWQRWAEYLPWATDPLVERAKYYEWQVRDFEAALAETETALQRLRLLPGGINRLQLTAELQHRRERLLCKRAKVE